MSEWRSVITGREESRARTTVLEKALREAKKALVNIGLILGTGKCSVNTCDGCKHETQEAAEEARSALEAIRRAMQ